MHAFPSLMVNARRHRLRDTDDNDTHVGTTNSSLGPLSL